MHQTGRGRHGRRPWFRIKRKSQINNNSNDNNRRSANESVMIPHSNENSTITTWNMYFPSKQYPPNSEVEKNIEAFAAYIEKNRAIFDLEKIDSTRSIPLDLVTLTSDNDFITSWPLFNNDLIENPDCTLTLLEYTLHKNLSCALKIKVRVLNHQPVVSLSNLKVNYFGKLVTIKGTVIRVGSVGLICTSAAFECMNCHNTQVMVQPQGVFSVPSYCRVCQNNTLFEPLQSAPQTVTTDWQTAAIQEIQSQSVSGTVPRSVDIELKDDLVGMACPGDILCVTGIVQVRSENKVGDDGKRSARLLQLYIETVSIHSQRNLSNPSLSFTLKDYYAIQEIHSSDDVFRLLVHSLCPSIFGHEVVKAGLILGIMGGTDTESNARSNPHVLVVGDPGLGKSQLLQAAAHAAPRGVYVCGASASAGGLTVALGREAGGDFALEAGALVLADRGVCCVDELDKMSAHYSSLLEAMEQRRVSVAKGGVVCCLAARATVLSAANPAGGNYNRAKTVSENLKLNSALLSRFDLVFILLDQPDEKHDAMLSDHVLAIHFGLKKKSSVKSNLDIGINVDNDLSNRLRLKRGEVIDTLPLVLMRKYIAYARRYVHPKLSTEAANALQNFYMELRQNQDGNDGTPITTRQLEACIRLTQAKARAELREEATVQDAKDVISLMKHSLVDTYSDEFGNIQLSRSIHGSGVSSRSKIKQFLEILMRHSQQINKDVFTKQELVQIHKSAGIKGNVNDLIEAMHIHSYLLLKSSNVYQLIGM